MKKVVLILALALFAQVLYSYTASGMKISKKTTSKQMVLPCCYDDDDYGKDPE